jgi:uncharacterized protein (TIGR02421 family)
MIDVQDIKDRLEAERIVDRALPGEGRIHIERPQPFICVYRTIADETDAGTQELVTGQASYLVIPADPAGYEAATEALAAAVDVLEQMFGAVLVVELFALPLAEDHDPEKGPPRPGFEIIAPQLQAPVETIEALEKALLEQSWPGGEPAINIAYQQHCVPEGLAPLLPASPRRREAVHDIALGVRAIHRDPVGKTVLPIVLREMRRSLTTALRQGFYAFSHAHARYRPAHYHELGTQTIDEVVWEIDRALADVGDSFDLILDSTPVNSSAAWSHFRASRYEKAPEFHYRPLLHDPGTLKRQLYAVPLERVEDPALHALFAEKRDELDSQIDLLGSRGTKRFLYGSLQIYGAPDDYLLTLARSIIAAIPPGARKRADDGSLDAESFARLAERELEHYRAECPSLKARVEIRDDVPGLIVSNGHFLVGRNAKVSASRAPATIAHEVGTHILTFYNGLAQPFRQLHTGMAGYEALQEGIAVLAEYLVGGLSRSRLRLLAGRVLAVAAVVDGADFIETVRMLHSEHGFGHRGAYTIAMRVHRSGGLTKDMVYLQGLDDLLRHLAESDMPFEDLLVGKFALDHLHLVEELRWRNILKEPMLQPHYLRDAKARDRLERVRQGLGPIDLIEGQAQ